ncbi:DUF2798 domain-containing protein [Mariprofundus ferrooxydans]|nr:DUF2798 domain-containing protein [Mariprofundus ferrooxydans]
MKHSILFSFVMSFFLSALMTLWVTYINLGIPAQFIEYWVKAFLLAWPVAALIAFVMAPLAKSITNYLLS